MIMKDGDDEMEGDGLLDTMTVQQKTNFFVRFINQIDIIDHQCCTYEYLSLIPIICQGKYSCWKSYMTSKIYS